MSIGDAKRSSEAKTVRGVIDEMACTQPEVPFLLSPETGRVLTFQGLRDQSIQLAVQLREAGIEPGGKVAFLLDNGLFTAQLFLGAMYGGFVSVPLNVRAGVSTLSHTIEHSDAKVIFVADQYSALLKEILANARHTIRVVPVGVDDVADAGEKLTSSAPLPSLAPEDVALLMYTSGSTGQPKAAVHSHRSVLAGARNSICSHQLSSADRSLLLLPLYHINAECVTLLPTLLSGGSVVVPHGFSISHFWDWLIDYQCTWSALVPTIIAQLLNWKDPRAASRQQCFQRIRFLRSSSAPLSPSQHREFLDKFKLLLIQAMGSTEAGNIFSNPLPPGANKIGSPGLPWGFETRIVDREGADVPQGEPGEVLIRGAALMDGYYKDPEWTATVLGPDGWFHTGDLAYRDEDGYFFVVGRSKELIIKGGVNIAPKQIDEVLESHPAVMEAAAVGVPDRYLGEDLVAFVIMRAGAVGDETELLTFCERSLGHFKTPTRIHFVNDLPKGPSGKVQRLKLLEKMPQPRGCEVGSPEGGAAMPDTGQSSSAAIPAVPALIEQTVAEIWAKLLAQPQVDVDSDFFSLGGHSLLAIQCLSRLRDKLGVALSLSEFVENATVAQQAALIQERSQRANPPGLESALAWEQHPPRQVGSRAAREVIPSRNRSQPCPLSPAQERVWFFQQLAPEVPLYNESEAVRLEGKLDVEAIERAFNVIISRHEILRTTIRVVDEQAVAIAHESWPLTIKRIDLSGFAPAKREAEIERLLVDEPRRPYRLEAEPGIRVTLVQVAPEDHILILMMHHIICDWSSEGVLWRELSALYRAFTRGEPPSLPALPIQHGDYAAWRRRQMVDGYFAQDLLYWEEWLRGAPDLVELPIDQPRPRALTYRGARKRFRIEAKLAHTLRDFGRREKISLFTLFTAALNTLLYRYTGGEDILLGIPLADRDRPELQSMIGFLLQTHALRTRLAGGMTFRELLARVQKGVLDLYSHRAPPFDQVVSRVQPKRNASYAPLFQVMINWRDRDQQLSFIGMDGLLVKSLLAESRTSKFDITLMLTGDLDDIGLEIEYSTDLFKENRIERLAGHYQTLLEAVAADPNQPLADLPLLTQRERRQLLVEWNQTERDYPRNKCLHELFEEQAERVPEATAVTFQDQRLTYRQLNEGANQLARTLRKLGVGPGTLVGICTERSLEMVIGLLGILKSGGAYVPLDPAYPKERIAFIADDARIAVLITQEDLLPQFPGTTARILCLDRDWRTIQAEAGSNLQRACAPADLAYVIYTSGSTGRPKGVAIEHRSPVAFAAWVCTVFSAKELAGVLFSTSICFDLSVFELFVTLAQGGRIILVKNVLELPTLRNANEVTLVNTVPSAMAELVRNGCLPPSVVTVNLAGEPLSSGLVDEVYRRGSVQQVYDLYGPSETTTYSTMALRRPGTKATIGRPIANTQVYLLDQNMQPVPVGVPGELHIGGVGLARGYYNRPDLTAERFLANPFSSEAGARLYKTGDQARYLSDGTLEFLGRLDDQVKVRGFRIELGEIATILNQHPAIREAVVVAREDVSGDKRLLAYVTPKDGKPPKDLELRGALQAKLPEYMVPSTFVILDQLPRTPNGKVDRKALPAVGNTRQHLQTSHAVPRTPTEEVLARIWSETLGLDEIGVHDNFFELGGHSLLAVRLFWRIEKLVGKRLPVSILFEAPTIEQIAKLLDTDVLQPHWKSLVPIKPGGSKPPFYCLHGCGGQILEYEHFSRYIDADQPLYGLQEPGLDGTQPRLKTLEEMATYYLQEIRAFQPEGPYYLGGGWVGSLIAYEMAQQLLAQGQQVGLLAIFDVWVPGHPKWPRNVTALQKKWSFYRIRLATHWQNIKLARKAEKVDYVRAKSIRIWNRRFRWRKRLVNKLRIGLLALREVLHMRLPLGAIREATERNRKTVRRYELRPYPGKVTLFRAKTQRPGIIPDATNGWKDYALGGLEVHEIPGHAGAIMREPRTRILVEKLTACLTAAFAENAEKKCPVRKMIDGRQVEMRKSRSIPSAIA